MECHAGALELVETGVPLVVVTIGSDRVQMFIINRGQIHYPANKLNVLDTTGAGDSFAAGFITCIFIKKKVLMNV